MVTVYVKPAPPVRLLLVTDIHWARRNPTAWALFEMFRRTYQPDHLICLGDLVEFATVGRWMDVAEAEDGTLTTPDPDELMQELAAAGAVLRRWRRDHPTALIDLCAGNHEARFQRYLASSARAALGLGNLVKRWRLAELDIAYTRYGKGKALPYGPHGLWITHGMRAGAHPAKTELALWGRPGVSGHVHRSDRAGKRVAGQGWQWWHSLPCLCDLDPSGAWAVNPTWENGWAVGSFWPDRNELQIEIVPVVGNRAVWHEHSWEVQP